MYTIEHVYVRIYAHKRTLLYAVHILSLEYETQILASPQVGNSRWLVRLLQGPSAQR